MFYPPRLSRSNVKHVYAALFAVSFAALPIAPSLADNIPTRESSERKIFRKEISHTDLFEGATGSTSGDLTGIAPLFGGLLGAVTAEPEHFIFNDSQAALRFVNFDTAGGADTVRSIWIVFGGDGNSLVNRRALDFRLFADLDLDSIYETTVIPTTSVVYNQSIPGFEVADIMMNLASEVTADLFRLEVDNVVGNASSANGARIFEFDAFSTTLVTGPPPSGVPEPASLALLGIGLAGLAAARRRKAA